MGFVVVPPGRAVPNCGDSLRARCTDYRQEGDNNTDDVPQRVAGLPINVSRLLPETCQTAGQQHGARVSVTHVSS